MPMMLYPLTTGLLALLLMVDISHTDDYNLVDLFKEKDIQILETNKNYLFVGELLTVRCKLTQSDQLSSPSLSFGRVAINGSPTSQEAPSHLCFDDSKVYHPDRYTAILNISVTPEMAGSYSCYKSHGCKGNIIGTANDVTVEYAPHGVVNFSCVLLNMEGMQCSWKDAVPYVNADDVQVHLTYAEGKRHIFFPCEMQLPHKCVWSKTSLANEYTAEVTVTNMKRNSSVHSIYLVNANSIVQSVHQNYDFSNPASSYQVQFDPVENLVVTSFPQHTGCVHLEWSHSKKHYRKIFRIKLYSTEEQKMGQPNGSVLVNNLTSMAYDACGFHAYKHLNFSVEAFPGGPGFSGFWSRPNYADGWTPEEAPESGPEIAMGSFVANKSSDHEDFDITLYWNEVDVNDRNGVIDSYRLLTPGGKVTTVSNSSSSLSRTLVMAGNIAETFTVSIFAHNSAGYSKSPSTWHIDPKNTRVPEAIRDSFVARIEKNDLVLEWENGGEDSYNVTVYWCFGSSPIGHCEKSLHWRRVHANTTPHYVIPPLNHNTYKFYSYGLSVAKADWTSGIFWTKCLIQNNPKVEPVPFTIDPLTDSLRVTWERHVCTYQSGFLIKRYVIKWCIKSQCTDSSKVQSKGVSAANNTYVIRNLPAGTDYQITMQVVLADGRTQEARWVDAVPLKEKSRSETIVIAVVLSSVGAVTIVVCFTFFARCICKIRDRSTQAKTDPDMNKVKPITPPQTSTSTESGGSTEGSGRPLLVSLAGCGRSGDYDAPTPFRQPELPSTQCPQLPTARPVSISGASGAQDRSSDLSSESRGVDGGPRREAVVVESFVNKAFDTSSSCTEKPVNLTVRDNDSEQENLSSYQKIGMTRSSGESMSCSTPSSEYQAPISILGNGIQVNTNMINDEQCIGPFNSLDETQHPQVNSNSLESTGPSDGYVFADWTSPSPILQRSIVPPSFPLANTPTSTAIEFSVLGNFETLPNTCTTTNETVIRADVHESRSQRAVVDLSQCPTSLSLFPPNNHNESETNGDLEIMLPVSDQNGGEMINFPEGSGCSEHEVAPYCDSVDTVCDPYLEVSDFTRSSSPFRNTQTPPVLQLQESVLEMPDDSLSNLSHSDYVQPPSQPFGWITNGEQPNDTHHFPLPTDPSNSYIQTLTPETNVILGVDLDQYNDDM